MTADPNIYASARLAESYARCRPPVHAAIIRRILDASIGTGRFDSALDVGCGGGASTAALLPHADNVVGVDPFAQMLAQAAQAVLGAAFVQGRIEALPFEAAAFALVASAGAINYAAPERALPELARVLKPGGWLALYDFSAGQRLARPSSLTERFAELRATYPPPGGYALDLAALPFAGVGLSMVLQQRFEVALPMSARQYIDYVMSETGVESAIQSGTSAAAARLTCERLFAPVFHQPEETVVFDAVLVMAQRLTKAVTPGAALDAAA